MRSHSDDFHPFTPNDARSRPPSLILNSLGLYVAFVLNYQVILFVLAAALVAYALFRLSARTARELRIPCEESAFPRQSVREALERMGCTISHDSTHVVSGTLPMTGACWGQKVVVTMHRHDLVVRSTFLMSQIFGGGVNQENVERFAQEWSHRGAYVRTDPEQAARHETFVLQNAARSTRTGVCMAVLAAIVLAVAIWVPSPNPGSSGKFWLIALSAPVFLMGCANVWNGIRQSRGRRPN